MDSKKNPPKPWENASKQETTGFPLRFTKYEHAYLKFFGETSYGESMNSIAVTAIHAEIERRCKEEGMEPPKWD